MAEKPVFDLFAPGEIASYARARLEDLNSGQSIHKYLPYVNVPDTDVRFTVTESGLVEEATFRQFGAQPDAGTTRGFQRRIVELMPIGRRGEITERDQMRLAVASTDEQRNAVADQVDSMVEAIAERLQRLAGQSIENGSAEIEEYGSLGQDFDRDADMEVTAGVLWDQESASPLDDIAAWKAAYRVKNKTAPGVLVTSERVAAALRKRLSALFQTSLPLTFEQANQVLLDQGLPKVELFDRETFSGRVLSDHRVFLLPESGSARATRQNALGGTFFGKTLASTLPEFQIKASDQPGLFASDYIAEGYPPVRKIVVDGLAMPILTNANMAMRADVLGASA